MADEHSIKSLFVYGTLRPDIGSAACLIEDGVIVGKAMTTGALYAIGDMPTLVEDPTDVVVGWLISFDHFSDRLWHSRVSDLDEYEGHPRLFTRRLVEVVVADDARSFSAYAYVFTNQAQAKRVGIHVETGDWADHNQGICSC